MNRRHESTPSVKHPLIRVISGCQDTPFCVPVRTNNGRPLGCLKKETALGSKKDKFSECILF